MNTRACKMTPRLLQNVAVFQYKLFRYAVSTALLQDLYEAWEIGRQVALLANTVVGYNVELRTLARGFLTDLLGVGLGTSAERRKWPGEESAGQYGLRGGSGELLERMPASEWLKEAQVPREKTAAILLCEALSLVLSNQLEEAAIVGLNARDRAFRENKLPLWLDAQESFLVPLLEGFPEDHPTRRMWEKSPKGRSCQPWPTNLH